MTLGEVLLGILAGVLAAECCGVSEWVARRLVGWGAWLSYGQTPQAQARLMEYAGDLDDCPGQITRLFYALGLVAQAIFGWLRRVIGRSGAHGGAGGMPGYFCRPAAEALSLALQGIELRGMPSGRRKDIRRLTTRLGELLRHPAEGFDRDGAAVLLNATASVCEAYIDDRDEREARRLAEAAWPHIERLGRSHPASLDARRAHAHALLQMGQYEDAGVLLRGMAQEENQIFGAGDPRTLRTGHLLLWVLVGEERPREAAAGFSALEALMARLPGAETPLLRHVQCKHCWTLGQLGDVRGSVEGYDRVIASRSREFGADHPDTLDARHSKGKLLVQVAGDGGQALAVLLPLLADRRRVLGGRHPDTLETRKYVAVSRALMRPDSSRHRRHALRDLRRIGRMQARRPGSGHPQTRDTERWLATLTGPSERS